MSVSMLELQRILSPDVLVELADDNGDGVADAAVLGAATNAAVQEVRHAVSGSVRLEGTELPPLLRDIAATFAVGRLYERRREALPGPWAERMQRARTLLGEVAEGRRSAEGIRPGRFAVAATRQPDDRQSTLARLKRL